MRPRYAPLLLIGLTLFASQGLAPFAVRAANEVLAPALPAWVADFEAVCARTPEVMALAPEELQRLVAECDRLQPHIEALPESPRKVYRKRLELTRKLLIFALEAKLLPPDK